MFEDGIETIVSFMNCNPNSSPLPQSPELWAPLTIRDWIHRFFQQLPENEKETLQEPTDQLRQHNAIA